MTSRVVTAQCPGGPSFAARAPLRSATAAVFLSVLSVSVPSKPNQAEPNAGTGAPVPVRLEASKLVPTRLIGSLEVGLAGPPVLGAGDGWWLLGRDGEIERFSVDDALSWSISIGAAVTGGAAIDEHGHLLFVPTARDLIFAVNSMARIHWRYRAPAGVSGPVSWVPGQGLVFLGRDHALYWLDGHANLVLRVPISVRISSGPTPFGSKILLGAEDGQLLAFSRQGRRESTTLRGPITSIVTAPNGILILAAGDAHWMDPGLHSLWSRPDILGIGVTAAPGHESRPVIPVILSASGVLEWLDPQGSSVARARSKIAPGAGCLPELAATETRAWVADDSGTLWEARAGGGWTSLLLSASPLWRPIVDTNGGRVLIGSADGSVWSRPL